MQTGVLWTPFTDMIPVAGTFRNSREPNPTAVRRPAPATPLFESTPNELAGPLGNGALNVLSRGEPTREYGVGLLRLRHDAPAWFAYLPAAHHTIWLHLARRLPVITRLAGRRFDCESSPGVIFTYPAATDLTIEALGAAEGILIRLSAECLALAGSQLGAHGGTLVEGIRFDDTLFQIAEALEAEAADGHPNGILFWSSAADAFIRRVAVHHLSRPAAPPRGAVSAQALETLQAYIQANLAGSLDLDSLAAVIGCDLYHFAHRFRATVGMSPHRYVMRLRLLRARERIQTGEGSLAEIAAGTGFADQSHLSRWIRRIYNLRPRDFKG